MSRFNEFKNAAFIYANNEELQRFLMDLGYEKDNTYGVDGGNCILTSTCRGFEPPVFMECTENYFKGRCNWADVRIDCGTDVEKFKTVVSERNEMYNNN